MEGGGKKVLVARRLVSLVFARLLKEMICLQPQ